MLGAAPYSRSHPNSGSFLSGIRPKYLGTDQAAGVAALAKVGTRAACVAVLILDEKSKTQQSGKQICDPEFVVPIFTQNANVGHIPPVLPRDRGRSCVAG
jgi:hypothetical protein